ncbi:uncharacterized protein BDW70DRAFT_129844 [Aspergillus foveolatus]|uniref:uncharacterized protein n=1 Tax=Aspergillus foveolatus TaxID=210207 RepID=UPI003CCDB717
MTGFPIVFALQNADAAGKFGWDIDCNHMVGGSKDEKFLDYYTGPQLVDILALNDFRYLADDILATPGRIYTRKRTLHTPRHIPRSREIPDIDMLGDGKETESTTWLDGSTMIARVSSSVVFTVVADGSGLDFEIPSDKCPLYSGQWTAGSGTSTDYPDPDSSKYEDRIPVRQLSQEQTSCLKDWFDGNNASDVSQSSLEKWHVLGESAVAFCAGNGISVACRPGENSRGAAS